MKILHTADWHIGKKLHSRSRLNEQIEIFAEIGRIADSEGVDAIVVAGDIFDTSVPLAEAEEVFFKTAAALVKKDRPFIAVAGNHDDAVRFSAPSPLGKYLGVKLIGGSENITIEKNGEKLHIAALSYPIHSKLSTPENKDKKYGEIVKEKLCEITSGFFESNSYNVLLTHLFMTKGGEEKEADGEKTDERELGTAALLPQSILPECDYTALGHIHKPFSVSKSKNVIYSGSILNYDFSDLSEKSVIIADFSFDGKNKKTDIKRIPLLSGKKLIREDCVDFTSALKALEDNPNAYVYITYNGPPMTASEISQLKKQPSFTYIENIFKIEAEKREFKKRTAQELFCDFFKRNTKKEPDKEIIEMFLKAVNNEEIE